MSMPTQSLFLYYDLLVLELFSILTTVPYFCPPPRPNLSDKTEPEALLCSALLSAPGRTRSACFSALCRRCSSCSLSSYWPYSFLVISLNTSALAAWEDSTYRDTRFRAAASPVPGHQPFSLCTCHGWTHRGGGPPPRAQQKTGSRNSRAKASKAEGKGVNRYIETERWHLILTYLITGKCSA